MSPLPEPEIKSSAQILEREMAEKLAPEKRHSFVHDGKTIFEWDQTLEEVNIYINLPPNVHSKQFYCKIQSKHVEVGIKGNPPYLNHDLTCPVKTDSSFWTLVGSTSYALCVVCKIGVFLFGVMEEDDIMHITLQKRDKGQTWASPILGEGQLDAYSSDLEQKRLMLQRFQEEVDIDMIVSDHVHCSKDDRSPLVLMYSSYFNDVYLMDHPCVRIAMIFITLNPGFDFSQAQFTGNCPDPRTFMGGIRNG
ncbi:hypothetical protein POTOM_001952 [Populus tomentosa]|uniref:CS domain-containing protein n=1 Tax=Populus tomentosa TaxID=118781 RepID=A0A8X8DIY3_POPTO|nr:hypothetical protein POTOM_001952 [Populus tomentosa]